jgi:hypothetical protein
MQWTARIDGSEALSLDLVKPNKFKGPAITWEQKPTGTPEPAAKPYVGKAAPKATPPPKPKTTNTPPGGSPRTVNYGNTAVVRKNSGKYVAK